MNEQTEANKKGHKTAAKLGFKATGSTVYGWRDAKVECVQCGHRLPWYHHHYQKLHRSRCEVTS